MTERMTTEQLKAIRKRAEEATDGPWEISNITDIFTELGAMNNEGVTADRNDGWQIAECGTGVTFVDGELTELTFDENQANTQFIAHAREDIPTLLAEVERLHEELDHSAAIAIDFERVSEEVAKSKEYVQQKLLEAESLLTDVHGFLEYIQYEDSDEYNAITDFLNGGDA